MTAKPPVKRSGAITFALKLVLGLGLAGFLMTMGFDSMRDKGLYEASQRGDSAAVLNLLDRGANPQFRSASGETACEAAEKIDRKDIVLMIGIYGGCEAK